MVLFSGRNAIKMKDSVWEGDSAVKTIIKEPDIWAAIIGGIFACGIAYFTYIKNKREEIKFAASMLLSDLMSIERYMTQEGKDTYDELADIRYSDKWQDIVGKCSFLNRNEVKRIQDSRNYRRLLEKLECKVI